MNDCITATATAAISKLQNITSRVYATESPQKPDNCSPGPQGGKAGGRNCGEEKKTLLDLALQNILLIFGCAYYVKQQIKSIITNE